MNRVYCVVEAPCEDCSGQGFTRYQMVNPITMYPTVWDVNCGRCFGTGWLEEYRYIDGEDGSSDTVEIPDPPNPQGTGCGDIDYGITDGTIESSLSLPR